ncbi:MAG: transglycosylase domain-containing protein [Mogibacterium sp.]|nr:transglycosylase domain-containing protein [Mogibacterium sp.]
MRSDLDERSETQREIDDFLSKFEDPADELSADYSPYLNEKNTTKMTAARSFYWKDVDSPDFKKIIEKNEKQEADNAHTIESSGTDNEAPIVPDVKNANEENRKPKKMKSKAKKTEVKKVEDNKSEAEKVEYNRYETNVTEDIKTENKESEVKKTEDAEIKNTKSQEKTSKKKKKKVKSKKPAAAPVTEETAAAAKQSPAKTPKKPKKTSKKVKSKRTKGSIKHALFYKKNKDYDPSQGKTYVKNGKTIKNKEYSFSFLKLLGDMVAVGMIFVLAGLIYALAIITVAPKYDYKDIYSAVATSSVVYNDDGELIDNIFYTENRKVVKYEDMPEDLINSFIAIEDKTFWKHHGFNWTRMIGAVLSSFTGSGKISGTSTITQQLARNVYLADTKSVRSIKRKLLEMYYASRLEHSLKKQEIIEAYLNTIYLGHGCYGVNAAAQTYFSKKVQDLDLVECAALAALPQSPDTYALLKLGTEAQNVVDSKVVATDPTTVVTNDLARDRRQLTLDLMLSQKYITKEQYDEVYDKKLNDFIKPDLASNNSIYSYFNEYLVDTIIADLMDQYGMEYESAERMVYTKGLQIYSTVDSTAMEVIAKEFQDEGNFPYVTASRDSAGNLLNEEGHINLYKYGNYFDEDGTFKLSGDDGDVKINRDGSITIVKDHKLHIYETEVDGSTDYSLEFKSYYFYDDNDTLFSIAGGYLNIPAAYKSADSEGNVVIDKAYFEDPLYEGALKISGNDVIITQSAYSLSPRQRQPQAAMTIVGVGTGEVKAMVGGRQFGGQKMLNRSLNPRQPGSSIKPLAVYGAALQKSYDLAASGQKWKFTDYHIDKQGTKGWGDYVTVHSSIEDEKTKIEGRYWPNNFDHHFSGKNTFKTAIQKSINTCAVKLELQIGSDYSVAQLKKFGLSTVDDDTSDPVNDVNPAALALGAMTEGVMPLEMALAYASFPGGGKVNTPICYYKVLDRDGELLLEGKSQQSEALNEGVAWIMTDVLRSVVKANGYMSVYDVVPGGKTGTTNDQYDIWFDGFTPSYAASLWIGTDENVEMSSMSTTAARLWGRIINQIPKAKEGSYAAQPSNVISKGGEYFTSGTETGLTSWSDKEAKEKAKKEAYDKWLKERENHKVKVIDVQGHYEQKYKTVHHDAVTHVEDVLIGYEQMEDPKNPGQFIDDPNKPKYQQQTVVDQAAYDEQVPDGDPVWIEEVWHWEYEPGWRDGDFKYKGD